MANDPIQPAKHLAAACGLFCPACRLYIGTHENPALVEDMAARWEMPVDHLWCDGCRAERRGFYCDQCTMRTCAEARGITYCNECVEYPCPLIKKFQAEMPHRIEMWENLDRIHEKGFEAWFEEKRRHYACPKCGVLNSAYDLVCRKCGHEPGNEYVRRHRAVIEGFVKERK
jgi:hypothetical protein